MNRLAVIVLAALLAILLASSMMYVVDQRRYGIVFEFGEVKRVIDEPGLYFKLPPPVQTVVLVDRRIQTLDNPDPDRYITAEKKNLLVNLFVKWQVVDPRRFFISFKGDTRLAQDRLTQIIRAALNEEFAKRTVREVISSERDKVMQSMRAKVAQESREIGINIIDVRLKRVDLLAEISDSVYHRMEAERTKVANELRSTGIAEAEQIKADADRQREVIIAEAYRKSEGIKGEGDAKAAQIYAEAYGRDPEFYRFYRSLEAYRAAFKDRRDLLVVDPNSDFFRFLREPGTPAPAKK